MDARNNLLKLVLAFSKASNKVKPQSRKKVAIVGIHKEKGWLYYVDEDGDIARTRAARGRTSKKEPKKKVAKKSVKKKVEIKKIKKPKKAVKKKFAIKKLNKPKKIVKKKIPNISKKKQLLLDKIKLLEKKHSKMKKVKGHDELKDKIKLLKQNLKKLK